MNTFELSLDLDKSYTGEPVRLRQGDKRGTEIRANIYDHGEPFTGSYTARYVQAIAGTSHEYYRADATFAAGVATVTVNEEYAAAVAGNAYGYFQFVSGSTVIASTQSFPVLILPDATAEAEVGERYDSAIEDALAELDEATGRISQMVVDATAEYLEAHPELTTTVEDNSLTDAKLIQKGGILQREQWLETMLTNIPRKATAESDVHSVTDSAGGGPLGIGVYGRSTQDGTPTPDAPVPIQSVQGNVVSEVKTGLFVNNVTSVIGASTGAQTAVAHVSRNTDYTLTYEGGNRCIVAGVDSPNIASGDAARILFSSSSKVSPKTFNSGENDYVAMFVATSAAPATDIALYAGSETYYPYVPYGSVGLHAVGRNLWSYGNRTFTRYVRVDFDTPLPAGTYTVSAVVTSADTDASTSVFTFRDANDIAVGSATLTRNSRASDVVTIARPATYCYLYSSTGASPSTGDEATWADIQVEVGSVAHAYMPYESVTLPIDLGGRSLRSLPDGTRDEVTVDEWGHATLTQRVGAHTLTSATAWSVDASPADYGYFYTRAFDSVIRGNYVYTGWCDRFPSSDTYLTPSRATRNVIAIGNDPSGTNSLRLSIAKSLLSEVSLAGLRAWLDANPTTFYYPLVTPVTIDLGNLDPALLPAPDLTAYVVPSAPSVLRYGFDVAAAIAELATA